MTRDDFWKLIKVSRKITDDNPEAQSEWLEAHLSTLPDDELVSFQEHFDTLYAPTYRNDLWGAAYLINGGCSDDGFDYFRAWLIGRGQKVYEAALASPDSLAKVAEDDCAEQEGLLSLAIGIWLKRHNKSWEHINDLQHDTSFVKVPIPDLDDSSEDWTDGAGDMDEKKGKKLYPKLFKKFW